MTYLPLPRTDIIKAELEEKQFKVKLTVIDTPGFGDYVNNRDSWNPIVDFIVRFLRSIPPSLPPRSEMSY
jgi:septin family protein